MSGVVGQEHPALAIVRGEALLASESGQPYGIPDSNVGFKQRATLSRNSSTVMGSLTGTCMRSWSNTVTTKEFAWEREYRGPCPISR